MNNVLKNNCGVFEIVESVPKDNYTLWNIGSNMTDGYLPIVQVIEGTYNVNTETMKAIKLKKAQIILSAIGGGQNTIKKMENYIKRYSNSKNSCTLRRVERIKKALEVMYTVKGVNNLI